MPSSVYVVVFVSNLYLPPGFARDGAWCDKLPDYAVNGKGKTMLARVLDGSLRYEGSVNCWGYDLRDYDPSIRVAHFTQTRRPKPLPLCELFRGETWTEDDEKLMQRVLEWAGISKIDLDKLHSQLSEGLRQKADLALFYFRVIKDKKVFACIIDEPMNHIAWPDKAIVGNGIYDFLEEFGSTAVVISHDPMVRVRRRVAPCNEYLEVISFNTAPTATRP